MNSALTKTVLIMMTLSMGFCSNLDKYAQNSVSCLLPKKEAIKDNRNDNDF